MPREPQSNIRDVCEAHAPRPHSALTCQPLDSFIGRWVRYGFPVCDGSCCMEHMWVYITHVVPPSTLVGTLDNDPTLDVGMAYGDIMRVPLALVEAVLPEQGA